MAYTEIELITNDIDIFLYDSKKIAHIASGGGNIPKEYINSDQYNEDVRLFYRGGASEVSQFEIEINPNLSQLLELTETELNDYLVDFIDLAKKGLHTYDKTKLGRFDDFTFHLVARPKQNKILTKAIDDVYERGVFKTSMELPISFEPFDLNNIK